jgi:hypothetical protein
VRRRENEGPRQGTREEERSGRNEEGEKDRALKERERRGGGVEG